MKKKIILVLLCVCISKIYGQEMVSSETNAVSNYKSEYIFSGQVLDDLDSVFYLQFTLSKTCLRTFDNLYFDNNNNVQSIPISNSISMDSIEVKVKTSTILVLFKSLVPDNPPVLLYGEDDNNNKYELFQHNDDGLVQNSQQIKEKYRLSREALKNY